LLSEKKTDKILNKVRNKKHAGGRVQLHQSKPPKEQPPMIQEAHHAEIASIQIRSEVSQWHPEFQKGQKRIMS
jgi:hypothetical protein